MVCTEPMSEDERLLLNLEREMIREALLRDPSILSRTLDPSGQLRETAKVLLQKRGCRR